MAINNISEQELVSRFRLDKKEAFSDVYDFYIERIYKFIYFKTMNREVAEDISSLVFLKAYQSLDKYRENNFSAWLYKITRNSVIDYYRQQRDNFDIDDYWDLKDEGEGADIKADRSIKIDQIKDLMQSFKSEERDIIIMRFWQDMSYREIALIIGKQEGAVKMMLGRSLKKLKAEMLAVLIGSSWQVINIVWKQIEIK